MGLNYELVLQEKLLSAYQREWLWHISVIPCPFVVCLICIPSALRPVALGLRVYISGKPLVSMVAITIT